jgi:predicted ArsR family transcriptional regulator
MAPEATPAGATTLGALDDPVRRSLYDYVAAQRTAVGRNDAAAATGTSRTLAAYHLDRLAEAGLLDVEFARRNGRTGPGAGRPAKLYSRAGTEVSVSVPPRDYRLLARLLAGAASADQSGAVLDALTDAAENEGREAAANAAGVLECLNTAGYEPGTDDDGTITMRNCPFHQIAQHAPQLVCAMNHALIKGILVGSESDPERAELAPLPGRCCVVIHPEAAEHAESASRVIDGGEGS